MKHFFSVLFVSIFCVGAAAQDHRTPTFSVIATFAPLSLSDLNAPTFQPGLSLAWNQRWGVHAEYGFHCNPFRVVRATNKDAMSTSRFRAELKYYPVKPNNRDKYGAFFMAAEGFRVAQEYRRFGGRYFIPHSGREFLFDTATVHRNIKGFSVKGGYEAYLDKRKKFLLEASGGVGMRYITNGHSNITNMLQQPGDFVNAFMDAFRFRRNDEWEGSKWRPHLAFTIRVGYRIL